MSATTSTTGGFGEIYDPERFEVTPDETSAFYHSERCGGFCDFACGGRWYERDDKSGIKLGLHGEKGWREVAP